MASTPCLVRVVAALAAATLCGAGVRAGQRGQAAYTVTSEVVSHPTTQEIQVFAPEAKGSWPVVLALHGVGGSGQDMGELGTRAGATGRGGVRADVPHRPEHGGRLRPSGSR